MENMNNLISKRNVFQESPRFKNLELLSIMTAELKFCLVEAKYNKNYEEDGRFTGNEKEEKLMVNVFLYERGENTEFILKHHVVSDIENLPFKKESMSCILFWDILDAVSSNKYLNRPSHTKERVTQTVNELLSPDGALYVFVENSLNLLSIKKSLANYSPLNHGNSANPSYKKNYFYYKNLFKGCNYIVENAYSIFQPIESSTAIVSCDHATGDIYYYREISKYLESSNGVLVIPNIFKFIVFKIINFLNRSKGCS